MYVISYSVTYHMIDVEAGLKHFFDNGNTGVFTRVIRALGGFIERDLVRVINEALNYSVVSDQCRGIIIVRSVLPRPTPQSTVPPLPEHRSIVENVIWSYGCHGNRGTAPLDYLRAIGVSDKGLSMHVSNVLCRNCDRCENNDNQPIAPNKFSPRPPSRDSLLRLVWNCQLFKSLHSLIKTIGNYDSFCTKRMHQMQYGGFKFFICILYDIRDK